MLARKRNRGPADHVEDITSEFAEMLRLGHDPQKLLNEIRREKRDKSEHIWRFKQRIAPEQTNGQAEKDDARERAIETMKLLREGKLP